MRNTLLKSTALAALLITSSFAYAQSPEPKSDQNAPATTHRGTAQEQKRDARPEPKGSAQQTAPKQESGRAQHEAQPSRNTAQEKSSPAASGQNANQPKQAQEQRKNAAEERKNAQEQHKGEDARKNASQQEKNKSRTGSSAQEPPKGAVTQAPAQNQQDKGKSTAAPPSQQQQQQKGATTQTPAQQQQKGATTQTPTPQQQQGATQTSSEQQQGTQAPAQQQKSTTQAPAQTQQPATAQSNAPSSTTNTTQQTTTQQNTNVTTNANQLPPQKQVQISETFSRTKVAPPERNLRSLNISINVGTVVPPRVRFHRLPREVWAIEPRYRDYDYFTTEEDIVIVEPRSHRIVSLVPRNPQRARAQATQVTQGGGSSLGSAQAGPPPCQIMRRDQNGQLTEVRPDDLAKPSTVGSGGQQGPALSVMVEANGGQNMPPIPLDAPGQIVVASQGNGDCQITIEPLQR